MESRQLSLAVGRGMELSLCACSLNKTLRYVKKNSVVRMQVSLTIAPSIVLDVDVDIGIEQMSGDRHGIKLDITEPERQSGSSLRHAAYSGNTIFLLLLPSCLLANLHS